MPFVLQYAIQRGIIIEDEFDSIMAKGLAQAKAGEGMELDDAFAELSRDI